MARPTKLTQDLIDTIVAAIRRGAYIETASAYAGINKSTLYRWLKTGARAKSGIHNKFCNAIEKALADSELVDLQTIDQHGRGYEVKKTVRVTRDGAIVEEREEISIRRDWQAAAWRLERKYPAKWGRRDHHEVVHSDGGLAVQVFLPDNGFGIRPATAEIPEEIRKRLGYDRLPGVKSSGNGDGDGRNGDED